MLFRSLAQRAGQQRPVVAHAKVHLSRGVHQRVFHRQAGDVLALHPVQRHQQAAEVVVGVAPRHGTQRPRGATIARSPMPRPALDPRRATGPIRWLRGQGQSGGREGRNRCLGG